MLRTLFIFSAFTLLFFNSISASATEKTVTLNVPGMTCAFCPITIRKALNNVSGVIEARSDFSTKTAIVKFDDSKTSIQALTRATENAGYPSTVKK